MSGNSSRILSASLRHSLLPILVADCRRRYIDANPAACLLLRLPLARVLELRVDDLTAPEHLPALQRRWDEFMSAGTQAGLYELLMPDGQRLHVAYSATVELNGGTHIAICDLHLDCDTNEAEIDEPTGRDDALSEREREILGLVALGETGSEIARELHISLATVETHIRHCLAKLGAKNRPHAVLLAIQRGEIALR